MDANTLFDLIGEVDEALISHDVTRSLAVSDSTYRRNNFWIPKGIGAAIIVLITISLWFAFALSSPHNINKSVFINELQEEPSITGFEICLLLRDFYAMTNDELMAYYDVNFAKTLLPGLFMQDQDPSNFNGIFKTDERGVYYDTNSFIYQNVESTKEVRVTISKNHIPYNFEYDANSGSFQNSKIGETDITVYHYQGSFHFDDNVELSDIYYAEFMLNNNGYAIMTKNISEEDFVNILVSLIN